ncbi:hypothetical protein Pan97_32630 [Bremerella volcania]|uniref:Cell division protein FtsQ n=1 Tax=Bremerella volcania TaxID=2527984 RepID=A0A518CAF4_9BACT|nr:hypothetical protein [Bremerella volcania]QDU76218.1 hypothetical protein Pan97_32630 [Bremerella volcania]
MGRSTQTPSGLLGLGSPAGRQLLLCVVITAAFLLLMIAGWNHYAEQFAVREEFLLSPREILISTPPAWIQSDVLADAVEKADLPDQLDLRDRELTNKVASAISAHAWVRSVQKVVKQYPAKVLVEVEYRRPVAMVEVEFVDEGAVRRGLIPVDIEGTVLPPGDFSRIQANDRYPRIQIDLKRPMVEAGMKWDNPRVAEAALIAAELLPHWSDLKLNRIILKEDSGQHYELELTDQTRIIWGSPPGKELPQETIAKHKVQVMLQKAAESSLSSHEAQPSLDLRTAGRAVTGLNPVHR